MDLFPAIDLKNGACVRLEKGVMEKATVYAADPARQAEKFESDGATFIHLVDLDGAFKGESVNASAVESVCRAVKAKVELGGGIRTLAAVENWLSKGVARVILGTAALKDPAFVKEACRLFPNRVAVGIDAKNGFVAVEGWVETSTVRDVDLAKRFEDCGVAAIIHTDVARDGVLQGANLAATAALAESVSLPVIISGGISDLDDLRACAALKPRNIAGVISGRAIYENRFTVAQAIAVLKGEQQ